MRRLLAVLIATLPFIPGRSSGQVVSTPEGTVEFVGLKHWTVEMVRDSMAKRAPGQPLGQCAAILRSIGFPSASSLHEQQPDGREYVVVTVVEPADSAVVHLRPSPADSLPDVPAWITTIRVFREANRAFQTALAGYSAHRTRDTATVGRFEALAGPDSSRMRAVWRFLDRHRRNSDLRLALQTLSRDRNPANSAAAAAILVNFASRNEVWWALADAQTDSRASVAVTATQVLASMSADSPRRVDWKPALRTVRDLLRGTNVFLFQEELEILRRTNLSPDLAAPLFADHGADLLLASLAASHAPTRDAARRFMVHVAGRDLGPDPLTWSRWIATLH